MAAVAAAGLALFVLDISLVSVWDGSFPLEVLLSGPSDQKVVEVAVEPLSRLEYADFLRIDPTRLGLQPKTIPWTEGQAFEVRVPCSGRSSSFGRELSYFQFKLLVVRITYQDGVVDFFPVEIPDGRLSRQVSVSIRRRQLSPKLLQNETSR